MSRNRWGWGGALPPVEPIDGQLELVPLDDDTEPYHCAACGALCDMRVGACECGPGCPLPAVDR
jgi:hypothetical protein